MSQDPCRLRSDSVFLLEECFEQEQREFMRLQTDMVHRLSPEPKLLDYIPLTPDQDHITVVKQNDPEHWESYYDHAWWSSDPFTPVIPYTNTTGRQVAEITRFARELQLEEISLLIMELHSTRARLAECLRIERERKERRVNNLLKAVALTAFGLLVTMAIDATMGNRHESEARQEAPQDRPQGDGRPAGSQAGDEPAG